MGNREESSLHLKGFSLFPDRIGKNNERVKGREAEVFGAERTFKGSTGRSSMEVGFLTVMLEVLSHILFGKKCLGGIPAGRPNLTDDGFGPSGGIFRPKPAW